MEMCFFSPFFLHQYELPWCDRWKTDTLVIFYSFSAILCIHVLHVCRQFFFPTVKLKACIYTVNSWRVYVSKWWHWWKSTVDLQVWSRKGDKEPWHESLNGRICFILHWWRSLHWFWYLHKVVTLKKEWCQKYLENVLYQISRCARAKSSEAVFCLWPKSADEHHTGRFLCKLKNIVKGF